jgi:CO/xanthine dehydrogenase FAD-binding subunit
MNHFDYAAPRTLVEAMGLLASSRGTTRVLAGGTDLIVQLREHLREAALVVDVKGIPELTECLDSENEGLRLGAAVPCSQIYENERLAKKYPALTDAARIIGGWQIQNRASIGGNLCNSSPAGDSIAPLIALGARCIVAGPSGNREVAAEDFCTGPGQNVLRKGELLSTLVFPPPVPSSGSAYERFIPRNEMDIAVAGAASWVELDRSGANIVKARIAVSAVAPTVKFAAEASAWLAGKPASQETFVRAGELARKVASPITDMRGTTEYRIHLVGVLTQRTLATATERARQQIPPRHAN